MINITQYVWCRDLHDRVISVRSFHFKTFLFLHVNLQPRGWIFEDIAEIHTDCQAVLDSIKKTEFQKCSQ
jgi:hypothetical protein